MSTENKFTMTEENKSELSNFNSLKSACLSADEQKVRNILSKCDCSNYLESSIGYELLCLTLLLILEKNGTLKENSMMSETHQIFEICKLLLQHGVKVNDETYLDLNTTPLHLAVRIENEKILKMLLAKGADVNTKKEEYSPLLHAITKNSKSMVQLLLENGANPDDCDNCDETYVSPLEFAIQFENEEIVKLLIANGSVVNKGKGRHSPLRLAICKNSKSMVQCLLEIGADPNDCDNCDEKFPSPLHLAVINDNEEIVKLLISKGATVNAKIQSYYPLHCSVTKNKNITQILLKNGADPGSCDALDQNNITPLHLAVLHNNKEMVDMLIANGAVINPKSHDLDTPRPRDVLKKFTNISQLFIENPDNPDNFNNHASQFDFEELTVTPLQIAILNENEEIVQILLSKGADVNAKNNLLHTALLYAVGRNLKHIAQLLLENGANLDIIDQHGHKPFDYAKNLNMKHLYSLYRIKMYLDNGGTIEETDDAGYTLLHHAVKYNSKDAVSFLLDSGCNLNAASKLGESPLHIAVKESNEKITALLIQSGCDINATTNTGCTPLHLAVNCTSRASDVDDIDLYSDKENLLKILIENGANKEIKNQLGFTPLNHAVRNQLPRKVRILLGENPDISDKALKMEFCLTFFNHEDSSGTCRRYGEKRQCLSKLFFDLGFRIDVEDFRDMHIPKELYPDWLSKFGTDEKFRSIVQNFLNEEAASNTIDRNRLFIKFQVLIGAAIHGFMDIFLTLFSPGMDVNARLQDGNTLLHLSSRKGELSIVEDLLRRGATVNVRNDKGESPLHISVEKGHTDVTKCLLDNGADIDARNASNDTPLFVEFEEPDLSRVRQLLEYGADVNFIRNEQCPLHVALDCYHRDIVKLLFHYGAFVNPSDSFKISPLFQIWEDYDEDFIDIHLESIDLLFNYGAKVVNLSTDPLLNANECAKFKVKSLAADLENFDFSVDSPEIAHFQIECRKEIATMKSMEIGGCNLSMYDLLIKPHRRSAMYMRNTNVVKMLDSIDFLKTFPIYAGKLNVCVMRSKLENRLLEIGSHCLEVILKRQFPEVVVDKIISYLNTSDLHRLIIASPIDEEKKSSVKYIESP